MESIGEKEERIRRAAIVAARRARFLKGEKFTQEDVRHLRIQTSRPITRIVCLLVGLLSCAISALFWNEGFPVWPILIFGVFALVMFLIAAFGRKKDLDGVLNGLDAGISNNLLSSIIDAIF